MKGKTNKTKKEIKLRDLKPVKDAKGGYPPDPCGPRGSNRGVSRDYGANHNEVFITDVG